MPDTEAEKMTPSCTTAFSHEKCLRKLSGKCQYDNTGNTVSKGRGRVVDISVKYV